LTIYADPANENLLEALTAIYVMKYPKVKFHFVYQPENQILQNILDTVAVAAFINKPLTPQQTKYLKQQTGVTPKSSLLAYDAAILITSAGSETDSVTFEDLRNDILNQKNKIVFDNGNSGNFNTIKDILKLDIPKGKKIDALDNAEMVIDFVKKSPGSIGVIGLNEISEKSNPKVKELLKEIKILPVVDSSNIAQMPTVPNILGFKYPFFKGVYFISREPGFGISGGFARFAGSEQGQLIVHREGLQPNYLYERNVQINLKPIE
jgi:phosphate transport system substrate-binding protein